MKVSGRQVLALKFRSLPVSENLSRDEMNAEVSEYIETINTLLRSQHIPFELDGSESSPIYELVEVLMPMSRYLALIAGEL